MSSFEFPSTGTTDASAAGVPATKGAVVVLVIGMAGMSPQQQQLLVTELITISMEVYLYHA
jgi:hypothetical protein